jgi:hypothetical protein
MHFLPHQVEMFVATVLPAMGGLKVTSIVAIFTGKEVATVLPAMGGRLQLLAG